MPVPEGMNSTPPSRGEETENLQQEEVFFIPIHSSDPIVTAVQEGTRAGRRNLRAQAFVDNSQWLDDMIVPKLESIVAKIRKFQEDK